LGTGIEGASTQVNAIAIIAGIIFIAAGAACQDLGVKVCLTLFGIVIILATALGFVSTVAGSLGLHTSFVRARDGKRKRNLCPKCLGRVVTRVRKDRVQYWCPRCKEVVPIPTTSKRLEKVRFEKREDEGEAPEQ
jgi:phage FluMu protein Com